MIDRNGTKLSRGTRVLVTIAADPTFSDSELVWTGRVIGPSFEGRVKVKSEYVTWKPARHLPTVMLERLADQKAPIRYEDEVTIYDDATGARLARKELAR